MIVGEKKHIRKLEPESDTINHAIELAATKVYAILNLLGLSGFLPWLKLGAVEENIRKGVGFCIGGLREDIKSQPAYGIPFCNIFMFVDEEDYVNLQINFELVP